MVSAQIPAKQGVGLVVEGHPVVLAGQLVALAAGAPQVVVAGLAVPAALLEERYQQVHLAYLADMLPHHQTIHLPEECCPHSGTHARHVCGQDFCSLDSVGTQTHQ